MPYRSDQSGSRYASTRNGTTSDRQSNQSKASRDSESSKVTDTIKLKRLQVQRDDILATRVAMTNEPNATFDEHLEELAREITEARLYMARTYSLKKGLYEGSSSAAPFPSVSTQRTPFLEGAKIMLTPEERTRYKTARGTIKQLREGETADWISELRMRGATTDEKEEPETLKGLKYLVKQANLNNHAMGEYVNNMTAATLIRFQEGNLEKDGLDPEMVRLLDQREVLTMEWHERGMDLDDLEPGQIWENVVRVGKEEGIPAEKQSSDDSVDSQEMAFDL